MIKDLWDKSATWLLRIAILLAVTSMFGILGWQVLEWLRTGVWVRLPLRGIFVYLGVDLTSVYNPTDWHGLAQIAQWLLNLPSALCIPVVIVGSALAWKGFVSNE